MANHFHIAVFCVSINAAHTWLGPHARRYSSTRGVTQARPVPGHEQTPLCYPFYRRFAASGHSHKRPRKASKPVAATTCGGAKQRGSACQG